MLFCGYGLARTHPRFVEVGYFCMSWARLPKQAPMGRSVMVVMGRVCVRWLAVRLACCLCFFTTRRNRNRIKLRARPRFRGCVPVSYALWLPTTTAGGCLLFLIAGLMPPQLEAKPVPA